MATLVGRGKGPIPMSARLDVCNDDLGETKWGAIFQSISSSRIKSGPGNLAEHVLLECDTEEVLSLFRADFYFLGINSPQAVRADRDGVCRVCRRSCRL
jgi:hypothetical protein